MDQWHGLIERGLPQLSAQQRIQLMNYSFIPVPNMNSGRVNDNW